MRGERDHRTEQDDDRPRAHARSRSARWAWQCSLLLIAALGGCSLPAAQDITRLCPAPAEKRFEQPVVRSAYVSLLQDRRALVERGQRAWIGLSYLDDDVFLEPLEVGILRLIARDLELSGWARRARLGARDRFTDEDLLFGVTLEAGSSSFTEGLADLALVLPTSAGKARVAFRITVTDRDGRRWGELTIDEMIEGRSSPVAGAQQQALERLLTATRAALDAMILELEKVGDPRPR